MQTEQQTARRPRRRRDVEQPALLGGTGELEESRHVALAADGLLAGLTREQVVAALIDRIERDAHYLAYRKACRRQTRYDEQVRADMRALSLAAVLLEEGPPGAAPSVPAVSDRPSGMRAEGGVRRDRRCGPAGRTTRAPPRR